MVCINRVLLKLPLLHEGMHEMSESQLTVMDVLKMLPKTNCRECQSPSCMAFAVHVVGGSKEPEVCPYLDAEAVKGFAGRVQKLKSHQEEREEALDSLQSKIREVDLSSVAEKLGGRMDGDLLAIKCLGKDFLIDQDGYLHSECHVNFWVLLPLLNYILLSKGSEMTGEWVKFDQLKESISWSNYFAHKCEKQLKAFIDEHTEVFYQTMDIFCGRPPEKEFTSDYSVVIYPLPKVPFLISYTKPDGDFDSTLSLFFDRSANDNIDLESIYILGMGIVEMLKKISDRHGGDYFNKM